MALVLLISVNASLKMKLLKAGIFQKQRVFNYRNDN